VFETNVSIKCFTYLVSQPVYITIPQTSVVCLETQSGNVIQSGATVGMSPSISLEHVLLEIHAFLLYNQTHGSNVS